MIPDRYELRLEDVYAGAAGREHVVAAGTREAIEACARLYPQERGHLERTRPGWRAWDTERDDGEVDAWLSFTGALVPCHFKPEKLMQQKFYLRIVRETPLCGGPTPTPRPELTRAELEDEWIRWCRADDERRASPEDAHAAATGRCYYCDSPSHGWRRCAHRDTDMRAIGVRP